MSQSCDLSSHAPAHRLPPELLVEIFVYRAETAGDELVPVTLGGVCCYWHSIVNASPRVWQHVFLNDKRRVEVSHHQARLWSVQAGTLPLFVHVCTGMQSADMVLPLLSPLLAQISRWRMCEITMGENTERLDFVTLRMSDPDSRLIRLDVITGPGPLPADVDDADSHTFATIPSTRSTNFHDIVMRTSLSAFPHAHQMTALLISELTISEDLGGSADVIRMLEFLTTVPVLQRFVFDGIPHNGMSFKTSSCPPIVRLPYLNTLILRGTNCMRIILSNIDAPRLAQLHLEHTNSDFAMRHDPYAGASEDGDSEDDAHDFSQSPWSDHATGMGLRALLRRSKPRLEVLKMNYTDMRTKDFRWCFEHMEYLREFRIVASDMSDRVLQILAPFTEQIRTDHGDVLEDSVTAVQPVQVRLPRLSSLGLWNCSRFSGDAAISALRSRIEYTDVAERDEVCTLTNVVISGCANFGAQHAIELFSVLGSRFHTS